MWTRTSIVEENADFNVLKYPQIPFRLIPDRLYVNVMEFLVLSSTPFQHSSKSDCQQRISSLEHLQPLQD